MHHILLHPAVVGTALLTASGLASASTFFEKQVQGGPGNASDYGLSFAPAPGGTPDFMSCTLPAIAALPGGAAPTAVCSGAASDLNNWIVTETGPGGTTLIDVQCVSSVGAPLPTVTLLPGNAFELSYISGNQIVDVTCTLINAYPTPTPTPTATPTPTPVPASIPLMGAISPIAAASALALLGLLGLRRRR
ncbi:MAG: hypothetical protein EOM91_07535 [Sphingobacteriia bacterium]|nr:hypothetical protein [Sphingobacteriia bacterium]NCC40538.1 hypothetical protein [Gammaproteobacteria bacterium]